MPRRSGGEAERRRGTTRIADGVRQAAQSAHAALRRITGMPDYPAYVRHLRERHPGCPVPTEQQFFEEYLRARYEGGPTRCC